MAFVELDLLPGYDLVKPGIGDLAAGRESVPALLVSIGYPRLVMLGLDLSQPHRDPEMRLYLILRDTYGDAAHSHYNALIRRLVSFERALACAR